MDNLARRAEEYATNKHKGQMYGCVPYTYHLESVVRNVLARNKEHPLLTTLVAIAWLHDVIEDCGVSVTELEKEFGICIAHSVAQLTKVKGQGYEEYMAQCCDSALAREVKICDTMANLTESFCSSGSVDLDIKDKGLKGLKKYPKQLAILVAGIWAGELVFYKGEING